MGWISGLTGLSNGALLVIIFVAILTNIPNIVSLINVFKKKKVASAELSDYEKMMYAGDKALNDCRTLIIANIPEQFNMIQKWVIELMLFKAFNGSAKLHIRGLATRNGFGSMSDIRFAEYCKEETPRVLRSVSTCMSDEWEGKENFFPMSREMYEKHNYDTASSQCAEIIVNWFKLCRAIKKKEQGVV